MQKILCFMVAALLVGCGEVVYNGQAFVKTSESTLKLSDLEIRVILKSAIIENLPKFKEGVSRLAAENESRKNSMNSMLIQLETLKAIAKSLSGNEKILKPLEQGGLASVLAELAKAEAITRSKLESIVQADQNLRAGQEPRIYFLSNYGSQLATTKTDADGRFKLKVDGKGPAVAVASKDQHYWFVILPKSPEESVFLSESTQHGAPSCGACLFGKDAASDIVSVVASYAVSVMGGAKYSPVLEPEADRSNDLYLKASALAARHRRILGAIGMLPVRKAQSAYLGDTSAAIIERAEIKKIEIQIEIDMIEAQQDQSDLTKATLEKFKEFNKRLQTI